ncbi:flagella basal body P-ring formation protein FlgA [Variovorax boronicumulans]|uniref:Flagella basal body P-ring formation protein FlgA n=1 Tax=Variovorax boronicumulans TaxID=436515 RepID=A0AAW8DXT6_9BURK|nr:flagellar basal body P-ring formation chaperone FlgA [Variovorax boronicumulans]MDP9878931.1 flagella basal body P-ring formation protein FlgA [Variovorax boronicumulans]MDP9924215.1 flagella basal body P-ring formation protein FlgA [Variovorax boronicumulans]
MTLSPLRQRLLRTACAVGLSCAVSTGAIASDATAKAVETYLQVQSAGLPGKVTVSLEGRGTDALPPCEAPEVFLPPGVTPWGRLSVGVRCHAERPWTRFVQARVAVEGRYLVAARAIDAGRALGAGDVVERTGDLTRLPRSVVTSAAELVGVVSANRVAPGAPIRKELLRGVAVIQQGQAVKVVAQGPGFVVSTEAKALSGAAVGAVVQARTLDGRVIRGVADEEGQVRLVQ